MDIDIDMDMDTDMDMDMCMCMCMQIDLDSMSVCANPRNPKPESKAEVHTNRAQSRRTLLPTVTPECGSKGLEIESCSAALAQASASSAADRTFPSSLTLCSPPPSARPPLRRS